jgi:hypothetical protein
MSTLPIAQVPPPRPADAEIVHRTGKPTILLQGWFREVWQMINGTLNKGFTGTIATAKLTTGGTNGSLTFQNGVLVKEVAPT